MKVYWIFCPLRVGMEDVVEGGCLVCWLTMKRIYHFLLVTPSKKRNSPITDLLGNKRQTPVYSSIAASKQGIS